MNDNQTKSQKSQGHAFLGESANSVGAWLQRSAFALFYFRPSLAAQGHSAVFNDGFGLYNFIIYLKGKTSVV